MGVINWTSVRRLLEGCRSAEHAVELGCGVVLPQLEPIIASLLGLTSKQMKRLLKGHVALFEGKLRDELFFLKQHPELEYFDFVGVRGIGAALRRVEVPGELGESGEVLLVTRVPLSSADPDFTTNNGMAEHALRRAAEHLATLKTLNVSSFFEAPAIHAVQWAVKRLDAVGVGQPWLEWFDSQEVRFDDQRRPLLYTPRRAESPATPLEVIPLAADRVAVRFAYTTLVFSLSASVANVVDAFATPYMVCVSSAGDLAFAKEDTVLSVRVNRTWSDHPTPHVFATSREANDGERVRLIDWSRGKHAWPFLEMVGTWQQVRCAPDGRSFVSDVSPFVHDTATGLGLARLPRSELPDAFVLLGQRVRTVSEGGELFEGTRKLDARIPDGCGLPRWSADGRLVALLRSDGSKRGVEPKALVLEADTGVLLSIDLEPLIPWLDPRPLRALEDRFKLLCIGGSAVGLMELPIEALRDRSENHIDGPLVIGDAALLQVRTQLASLSHWPQLDVIREATC